MIPLRNFKLSRRNVLRGLAGGMAASVALPPLEAMFNNNATAYANGDGLPVRFISTFWGNGVSLNLWEPAQTGAGFQLPEQLAPFANVQEYVTICSGVSNLNPLNTTHHEGMTGFNGWVHEGFPSQAIASNFAGPTIDQLIADAIATRVTTTIPSIQVQCSKGDSPADAGTTARALSVRGEPGNLNALYPQTNPRAVWNSVFGNFAPQADDGELRLSILDMVREDANRLRSRLGTRDNQRLDAHFDGLAELELKIATAPPACTLPVEPTHENGEPVNVEQLALTNQLMSELIAFAFVCDVTRVASNLLFPLAGEARLSEVPTTNTTHHLHSHSDDQGYRDGVTFLMARIAETCEILAATEDIDGTNLLDSTIIYGTSDCSRGWTHDVERQPILLAGHGRGHLVHPGIHYQAVAAATPHLPGAPSSGNMSDVLLSILQGFDPQATSIGGGVTQSNSPLTQILG